MEQAGLSTDGLCVKPGASSAAFSAMLDGAGEQICGVADMGVLEQCPREHLDSFTFWDSQVLLIDSNIGIESLGYILSRSSNIPHVIYEPIS